MSNKQKTFLLWFVLVCLWNFGVPAAPPLYDVVIAVVLSFFSTWLNSKL